MPANPVTPVTLNQILDSTRATVAQQKSLHSHRDLLARARDLPPRRPFIAPLRAATTPTRIIAEIKRASPSAGLIRPEYAHPIFDPAPIASAYASAGASAISCLTEERYFLGSLSYISRIKVAVDLPVLRKDFLIDPWQLAQALAADADAVLLIAECLPGSQLADMAALAHDLGLPTLIEVHDDENAARAFDIVAAAPNMALLGVNNRDLSTMKVDLAQTERVIALLSAAVAARGTQDEHKAIGKSTNIASSTVSESGIKLPTDLARLRTMGVDIALVGEHLMKQPDPGFALKALLT